MFAKIKPDIYKVPLVAIILILAVASLGVVAQPALAAAKSCAQKHTVQRGESLYAISLQYGVSWQTIAALNHLSSPYRLVSGERLCISNTSSTTGTGTGTGGSNTPSTGTNTGGTTSGGTGYGTNNGGANSGTAGTGTGGATLPNTGGTGAQAAACTRSVTVASGESLYSIGLRYGVTWQELAVANRIKRPFRVFVGQTLCIPARTSTSTGTGGASSSTGTSSGAGTTGNNNTGGSGANNNMGGGGSQSGGGQLPGYTNP